MGLIKDIYNEEFYKAFASSLTKTLPNFVSTKFIDLVLVDAFYEMGIKRVVFARELSIDEIDSIDVPIEIIVSPIIISGIWNLFAILLFALQSGVFLPYVMLRHHHVLSA